MKISYKKLWIRLIEKRYIPGDAQKRSQYSDRYNDQAPQKRGGGFIGTAPYLRVS